MPVTIVMERNFSKGEAGIIRYSLPYLLSVIFPYTLGANERMSTASPVAKIAHLEISPGTFHSKLKHSDSTP